MTRPAIDPRRITFGVAAVGILGAVAASAAGPSTAPSAGAAPGTCTASGLASTASGVLSAAGGYLAAHPDADNVLTAAASQPPADAKSSVRGYFMAHPGEFLDLQGIARPLTNLRDQCGVSVSPSQLANLMETLSD